jgi:hypothetical protein
VSWHWDRSIFLSASLELEAGWLDVSAETRSGIGRLPFDLIRIGRLCSHESHLMGRALVRVKSFLRLQDESL